MKNRRISITSSIIEGIERMLNSDCSNDSDIEYVSNWIQNIKRFPVQKYSEDSFPNALSEKLNLIKNQYADKIVEKNGLVYHKSILDAFMYIAKNNEKNGETSNISASIEEE